MKMTSKTIQHGGVSGNRFFSNHNSCVRSVAFNPKERYLFCSGGNDGQIAIYHAGRAELLNTHSVISSGLNRYVSAVGFACCGQKILAATSSRRVSVIDVEHGTAIQSYDNCAVSPSRDRTPMALDPTCPNIAACSYVNGKGITILDTRLPLPLNFIFDFHSDTIRDITFLHESWPFLKPSSSSPSSLLETKVGGHSSSGYTLLSLSSQGVAKVTSLDGRLLHTFDYGYPANSIAATPEHYGATHDGFASAWVCGGNFISSYVPNEEALRPQQQQSSNNDLEHHSLSLPSQIHFNPTYNPNLGSNNSRRNNNPADGNANSSNNQQPWNQSFNVIISNPNNVNLNVYQMPRRNELIFGSIDSLRISRAIRSLVASSHQQVNNSNSNSSNNENSSNSQLLQSSSSSSSSSLSQVLGAGAVAVNSNSGNNNNPGSSRSNNSGSSSNNRFRRALIHQIPYEQMRFNLERNENNQNNSIANNNNDNNYVNNILNDYNDDDEDDDDEDDDDEDDDDDENGNGNEDRNLDTAMIDQEYQPTINRKIDLHTPINSFVKKTLFYHDHWDRTPTIPDHPQQIWRLRFSSNGAHLFAAGEGGFVRSYRRYPNLAMHCVGEVYRHRNDIVDMDISPYDEFLVTASKDKTVGFICLGSPSHGWTEYYEYT